MYGTVRGLLGPKWTIEVLALIENEGPIRFMTIEEKIDTSSDIVTKRLGDLRTHGLIERDAETKRNVSYSITSKGSEVMAIIRELHTRLTD